MSCLERKIELLQKLNRGTEAYSTVNDLLNSKQFTEPKKMEQLKTWKAELKQFKPKGGLHVEKANKEETNNSGDKCFLSLSTRAELYRDTYNSRIGLKATGDIAVGTKVLVEQPVVSTLAKQSISSHCANCLVNCANTFWPCSHCIEVVFCSQKCAKQDSVHVKECGVVGVIYCRMSAQVVPGMLKCSDIMNVKSLTEQTFIYV